MSEEWRIKEGLDSIAKRLGVELERSIILGTDLNYSDLKDVVNSCYSSLLAGKVGELRKSGDAIGGRDIERIIDATYETARHVYMRAAYKMALRN